MPLYELFAIAKPAVGKAALAEMMRAVGSTVMQQGGVVTDIMSYGQRKLAYDIRQPGSRYGEANMWQVNFVASPKTLQDIDHSLRVDERVLRWIVLKRRPYNRLPTPHAVAQRAEKLYQQINGPAAAKAGRQ
ncbi:hypothetical protein ABPG77_005032 [Micractinium sp. CCAP 211/92]